MIKVEIDDYIYDTKSKKELPSYYTKSGVTRISEPKLIFTDDVFLYKSLIKKGFDIPDEDRLLILNFLMNKKQINSCPRELYYIKNDCIIEYYKYELLSAIPDLFYGILYGDKFKVEYNTFEKSVKEIFQKIINIIAADYKDNIRKRHVILIIYENYNKICEKGLEVILKYLTKIYFNYLGFYFLL